MCDSRFLFLNIEKTYSPNYSTDENGKVTVKEKKKNLLQLKLLILYFKRCPVCSCRFCVVSRTRYLINNNLWYDKVTLTHYFYLLSGCPLDF